jgi:hypothetical protein
MSNITQQDYFLKNFVSKSLGVIAAKETDENFFNFLNIIIQNIEDSLNSNKMILFDNYLRLILNILELSDDTKCVIAGELIPIILRIFQVSNVIFINKFS